MYDYFLILIFLLIHKLTHALIKFNSWRAKWSINDCVINNESFVIVNPCYVRLSPIPLTDNHKTQRCLSSHKKYICVNKCGSSFVRRIELKMHLRYRCPQVPLFKCPFCDHYTKWRFNLQKHARIRHQSKAVVRGILFKERRSL